MLRARTAEHVIDEMPSQMPADYAIGVVEDTVVELLAGRRNEDGRIACLLVTITCGLRRRLETPVQVQLPWCQCAPAKLPWLARGGILGDSRATGWVLNHGTEGASFMNPRSESHDSSSEEANLPAETASGQGFETSSVLTVAAAHGLHDIYQSFLPPLLPAFIESYSLSLAQAGTLAMLLDMPSLLQPIVGHWSDRVNLRSLVYLGPAITAVAMSLLGIAPNYGILALLLAVAGISRAGFHAVAPAVAGRLSGRRLGHGMGLWMVGGKLGPTLGPILVVGVLTYLGLRSLPVLMVPALLASLVLYLRLRDVQHGAGPAQQQQTSAQTLGDMAPLMLLVGSIATVRAFMTSALGIYLPTYLTEQGAELWFAGLALSVVQGAGMLGGWLAGALSDRMGRRATLVSAFCTAPIFMLLSMRVSGYLQLFVLFFVGLTAMSTMSVFMALVQESFPANRGLANSLYLALSFVIHSVVGVAIGAAGDRFGLNRVMTAGAFIFLLGVPLVMRLPARLTHQTR
jgi:FSR family fosmidomycin resistance protein-like MFS transporter